MYPKQLGELALFANRIISLFYTINNVNHNAGLKAPKLKQIDPMSMSMSFHI